VATAPEWRAPLPPLGARFDFDEFNEQFKQQFGYAL